MIYFLKADNRVKIGYTNDPLTRIPNIRTSSPFELEVLLIIDGAHNREQELHGLFNEYRLIGEWFEFSDDINEFILSKISEDRRYELGFLDKVFCGNEQILMLRKRHRLTLKELSDKLNTSKQSVHELQRGEINGTITIGKMKKIAEAMGYVFEYRFKKI